MVDAGRPTVRLLLGSIGHLVHYGDDAEGWLGDLFEQFIDALRRTKSAGVNGLLPGDVVEVVLPRPDLHLKVGDRLRIYWVGDDGTVDVGAESLVDEYLVSTVQRQDVRLLDDGLDAPRREPEW